MDAYAPGTQDDRSYAGQVAGVAREAERITDLLQTADLETAVTWCGGWTVGDLVVHLGGVHRWARAGLGVPPDAPAPHSEPAPAGLERQELVGWFIAGAEALTRALRDTDPGRPCWTLAPPATAAFWARRQVHETTVHRWDVEQAGLSDGSRAGIDHEVALDGIDEVVAAMLPRQVRLGRLPRTPDWIELAPDGAARTVVCADPDPGDRAAAPVAVVAGSPAELLLMLWGRGDLGALRVEGDPVALAAFLARPLTP